MAPALPSPDPAGPLLEALLEPLLDDFGRSFSRGLQLLTLCPEEVMEASTRHRFRERLEQAAAELAAARALRAAAPRPIALDMATIHPWHRLVVEVWSLSSALRAAEIPLPGTGGVDP